MKTQLQRPSVGKAKFTPEYKQQALEHWKNSGRSAARVAAPVPTRPSHPGRSRGDGNVSSAKLLPVAQRLGGVRPALSDLK